MGLYDGFFLRLQAPQKLQKIPNKISSIAYFILQEYLGYSKDIGVCIMVTLLLFLLQNTYSDFFEVTGSKNITKNPKRIY